jgi:hypothetical protein
MYPLALDYNKIQCITFDLLPYLEAPDVRKTGLEDI